LAVAVTFITVELDDSRPLASTLGPTVRVSVTLRNIGAVVGKVAWERTNSTVSPSTAN